MFKVNNKDIANFIVNLEHISYIFLVFTVDFEQLVAS